MHRKRLTGGFSMPLQNCNFVELTIACQYKYTISAGEALTGLPHGGGNPIGSSCLSAVASRECLPASGGYFPYGWNLCA
jgi:hypothetical protein